jgi:ABC-type polar amino acid transport system ATPase subunit
MTPDNTMIQVQMLDKHHGPQHVLRGVCLTVRRGEVTVIVGPSGGGKSTLLRCINGLERFQQGSIRVDDLTLHPGHLPSHILRSLRQRVGMVFQQFHLFPHLCVLDNVLAGPLWAQGRQRSEAEPEARALLERVGLADKIGARPEELSGGQQQRVAIARALAVKPEAILFDEPTSALDPKMAGEVLAVMADLAKGGQTMIVVTHAMNFARRAAHTVHVMHAGGIAESGPPEQIFHDPRTEVTKQFLHETEQG